jgi:hypothetical protein
MLFTVTKVSLFKPMLTQMMTRQTGNVSMYRWALARLDKITQTTYENAKYAIA